jgi:hypothetical protein
VASELLQRVSCRGRCAACRDVLEKGEADDAVVCAFVEGEGGGAEGRRLCVSAVDA